MNFALDTYLHLLAACSISLEFAPVRAYIQFLASVFLQISVFKHIAFAQILIFQYILRKSCYINFILSFIKAV